MTLQRWLRERDICWCPSPTFCSSVLVSQTRGHRRGRWMAPPQSGTAGHSCPFSGMPLRPSDLFPSSLRSPQNDTSQGCRGPHLLSQNLGLLCLQIAPRCGRPPLPISWPWLGLPAPLSGPLKGSCKIMARFTSLMTPHQQVLNVLSTRQARRWGHCRERGKALALRLDVLRHVTTPRSPASRVLPSRTQDLAPRPWPSPQIIQLLSACVFLP